MCGIAGIVSRDVLAPEQVELVRSINRRLRHRGPDGEGFFQGDHVALAMRRLSIIDLATGWQPLYNEDRSIALVANGEVYNFVELRRELEARGHRFATHSDCETIVHLYEEHGDRCVDHLRGMFAFAIWDSRRRKLLLGRDRLGEKPLYLAVKNDQIIFASELKALIGAGAVPFELDPAAVHLYYHYSYVPEPRTAVKGVRKLPAASTLSVEVDRWAVHEHRYWRMEDAPPLHENPATVIREELERISEIVIRSDVPVGVALSGGLDSSVIATLAVKKYPGTMHAISVGYPGRPMQDERDDAKALADHLKMPFHEVELDTDEMVSMLPDVVYDRDDPIADYSGVSYYAVLKRARELNVPVMLSGHGGDEMFWGYRWVREAVGFNERKAARLACNGVGFMDYLRVTRPPYSFTGGVRWLKSLAGLRTSWRQYRRDVTDPPERMVFYDLTASFGDSQRLLGGYYTADFRQRVAGTDPYEFFTVPRPWPQIDVAVTRLICDTYMIENGLAQGDRLSMAHSVELRLPLVDYRLVEKVIGLRKAHRDLELGPKRWLRDAVKDVVPEFVLNRRKRGFSPPWRPWTRALDQAHGRRLVDGYLVSQGILTGEAGRRAQRQLQPHRFGMPSAIAEMSLLLEIWCRRMAESAGTPAPDAASRAELVGR